MKRFTATEKWGKEWFQNLTPTSKCLWFYLIENCDCAGVWEGNWRLASFQVGTDLSEKDLEVFGERIERLVGGKVWLVGFVGFQAGKLSRECKPHVAIIRQLEKHGLSNRYPEIINSDSIPLAKGMLTLEEEEKDKDKKLEKEPEEDQAKVEEKARKNRELKALAVRVGAIMHRKPGTEWSEKEKAALRKLYPIPEEDLVLMEKFYAANIPQDSDYRRHELATLLNNWSGELDKARKFFAAQSQVKPKPDRPY